MAIQTRLQPKHVAQKSLFVVVCIVFGLWGAYDFFISIPGQQRLYERGQIYQKVHDAMVAGGEGDAEASTLVGDAIKAIGDELAPIAAQARQIAVEETPEGLKEAIKATNQEQWVRELASLNTALRQLEATLPSIPQSPLYAEVSEALSARLSDTGEISPPGKYDRLMKGAIFMPCFPYGLWLLWQLVSQRRRVYRLDDDGTLHSTEFGAWKREDIAGIEMDRWMSKSVAIVLHTDGSRLRLDDYYYKNSDLIVGTLASELLPDAWTADAKPVKSDDDDSDADGGFEDDHDGDALTDDAAPEAEAEVSTLPEN